MRHLFEGKTILVTGGTGSIGSEIVRQLLSHGPKAIRIFSRDEDRQHQLMQELFSHQSVLRFLIGDVRDKERLAVAMDGVDIVFHAAALKQVSLCEHNPFEAVKTNVLGTQNIIDVAREKDVEKVIGISTDKVAEPVGVLGVSKLMAEKLFLASYYYRGNKETKFACVRFGNVLGSRGSVLPTLKRSIERKGAVEMTDPDMTRFVMTIPQAVSLVFRAAEMMRGQEIFVLKMPSVFLRDLITTAVAYFAPLVGKKASDILITTVGKRSGEKKHEKLLADYELENALETEDMYILTPLLGHAGQAYSEHYPKAKTAVPSSLYSSQNAPRLSPEELRAHIKEADARS